MKITIELNLDATRAQGELIAADLMATRDLPSAFEAKLLSWHVVGAEEQAQRDMGPWEEVRELAKARLAQMHDARRDVT